jgi:hypothetical protein
MRVLLGTVLITLVPVILLNLLVDPFAIYGVGIFPRTEVSGYDEKLTLLDEFEPKPECLIIGSSRTLAFDPDVVEDLIGKRTFNFSGPGARAEIIYATLNIALNNSDSPIDTLIIGVDPESFHPTLPIQPEVVYIDDFARYFKYDDVGVMTLGERVRRLLSFEMTQESVGSIRKLIKERYGIRKMVVSGNGLATWVQRERDIADGTFDLQNRLDQRVRKYPERSLFLSSFTELSQVRIQYWEDLLEICRENNIRVYAFLPSTHPQLYDLYQSIGADEIIGEVSDYLESSIGETGGVYRDYTSIDSFGGNPDDFYDEIHMRPQNCELLLRDLLEESTG